MVKTKEVEVRIKTGVVGFDILCEGGLLTDSLNLVLGNAGSGKTTFLLQFLYNGAAINENGLYVSFEPEVRDLFRAGKRQGMDFEKLDSEGKVKLVKMDLNLPIKEIQSQIYKIILKNDVKRVCIDPINVFSLSLSKEISVRKQVYDFLSFLKKLGVCVLVAGESDEDSNGTYDLSDEIKFTKYAVDGVIDLFSSGIGGEGDRAIRISKMRMTNHFRGPLAFAITDTGIKILGKPSKN